MHIGNRYQCALNDLPGNRGKSPRDRGFFILTGSDTIFTIPGILNYVPVYITKITLIYLHP